jgi:hypothetical protein
LLEFVNDMDKQLEARFKQAQQFVESLLAQDDVEKATRRTWTASRRMRWRSSTDAAAGFRKERLHPHG